MNFTKSIAAIALTSLLFVSCKKNTVETTSTTTASTETTVPKVKKEIATANLQTASFKVEGMSCAIGCAKTIQEDLTGLEGVQKATVDFDTKLATVTFDKTIQTPEKLTKVVEAAADGKTYTVSNMKS
ncbi:heavy-metal-associated domain-containing protein [Flavobacterium gawalongense]|uniref:heavy-metal-associated domain-containing protein n=1 Tax=Flavobacterium gawalongense TaxID=2594432 RepID=UPI001184101B|nr:heavy metal-associated domain-containing protein [Flavobacterium gawalongense]TRX13112.1 heavy-metal-associated domain-containing protein [Flavobacterium gawalongense]TRX30826.1 heavy-metal-associated domain-containing protein [Flavobacterium gawalongense]